MHIAHGESEAVLLGICLALELEQGGVVEEEPNISSEG